MKTVKFYTLGCKVNQYETQVIREQFQQAGFRELNDSAPASVCLINTCTVTHRADSSSLYLIRRVSRQNPDARVIVTGCLTQFDADKIASIPRVSLIVKNKDKNRIVSLVNNSTDNRQPTTDNCFGITYFKNHSRAFLKIQDGCNYHCSYCKVCLVRGRSQSYAPSKIKKEAATLVRNGYLELVLCGVCLGSYGMDLIPKFNLAKLIQELQGLQGYFRIRLSSIEVNDITDELLNTMNRSKRLCRHLHIPVQSGDGQILRRMNRTYSPGQYIQLVQQIRRYMPEIAITTDVMVGFPGETEESFKNTVELIKKIRPLRVHIFPYSRRLNTAAYNLGEPVPESEIKLRIVNLKKVVQVTRLTYCEKFISQIAGVLVERRVTGSSELWEGHTDNYIKIIVKSNLNLENQIIQARLRRIYDEFVLADIHPG